MFKWASSSMIYAPIQIRNCIQGASPAVMSEVAPC